MCREYRSHRDNLPQKKSQRAPSFSGFRYSQVVQELVSALQDVGKDNQVSDFLGGL